MKVFFTLSFVFSFHVLLYTQVNTAPDTSVSEKTFVYKTVKGVAIKADLFKKNKNKAIPPCIIWIHGGGLIFGSRKDLPQEQKQFYLEAGYAVLSVDYRLAPETKLPEIVEDISDAVDWAYQHATALLAVDPGKIIVVGHSAGAYLALMTGYRPAHRPAAIVSFYGYGDIQSAWYSQPDSFYRAQPLVSADRAKSLLKDSILTSASVQDRFDLYKYTRQNGLWPSWVSGHDPINESEWFHSYCPIKNMHAGYPPVLLIHGDRDTDVPFEQSVLLHKEMESKKVNHEFIRVTGSGHLFDVFEGGLAQPKVAAVFASVLAFLKEQ